MARRTAAKEHPPLHGIRRSVRERTLALATAAAALIVSFSVLAAAPEQGSEPALTVAGSSLSERELDSVDTTWDAAGNHAAGPARRPLPERLVLAAREAFEASIGAAVRGTTAPDDTTLPADAVAVRPLAGKGDLAPSHRWLTDTYRID